jgi:iron complex outermembrane receptor protein
MVSSALLGLIACAGTAQAQSQAAETTDSNQIVVSGIRASLKSSIGVKRAANAVVDVITAEGIGKFPDRNVAESLAHIPGVSVDHQFGAGEKVAIQGTDPALNRILIDDHSIASTDWGGAPATSRAVPSTTRCWRPRSSRASRSTSRPKRASTRAAWAAP